MAGTKKTKKAAAPETPKKNAVKVLGTKLCTIDAEALVGFVSKMTGRGLPHIILRLNEAGMWVKQSCEMSYRYIFGKLSSETASDWAVTDEVALPIGNINKFRDVLKTFKGDVTLSLDEDDLVIQGGSKKFKYILFDFSTIAGGEDGSEDSRCHPLNLQVSFMHDEAEAVAYMVPSDKLFELAKAFPLTEAKTIKFAFDAAGFTAVIREQRTHGLEMRLDVESSTHNEDIEVMYDGDGFKEITDRLTTPSVKLSVNKNSKGVPMLGFLEAGKDWLFANFVTPTMEEEG